VGRFYFYGVSGIELRIHTLICDTTADKENGDT